MEGCFAEDARAQQQRQKMCSIAGCGDFKLPRDLVATVITGTFASASPTTLPSRFNVRLPLALELVNIQHYLLSYFPNCCFPNIVAAGFVQGKG